MPTESIRKRRIIKETPMAALLNPKTISAATYKANTFSSSPPLLFSSSTFTVSPCPFHFHSTSTTNRNTKGLKIKCSVGLEPSATPGYGKGTHCQKRRSGGNELCSSGTVEVLKLADLQVQDVNIVVSIYTTPAVDPNAEMQFRLMETVMCIAQQIRQHKSGVLNVRGMNDPEKTKQGLRVKCSFSGRSVEPLTVEINIPELNPEMDVYRIGTLMELVRVLALSFADDGKHVKVCVQGSMGEGALAGMPLQLAGTRKILEFMDWGNYGAMGTFVNIGSIGAKEVDEQDDVFILVAPQNAVGNCIIDDLKAMTDAAGNRPVILINPRLKDLPASSGIMQTMGRDKRLEYAASFQNCYSFRLLYYAGTQYPIMGALRMSYPYCYELYKRMNEPSGKEKYVLMATFVKKPDVDEINDAFEGKPRNQEKKTSGFW
ncbi:hypothetical protein IFM89_004349 [Coptis chinensis]|uniref:DUF1995 domain-containing protein n=1 Tax=Coptis chinensis TaxID=261450 RepID=A0A835IAE9_9MAGN|nr:hypothetical protein IFM89_004349 [Coptis chinensis]